MFLGGLMSSLVEFLYQGVKSNGTDFQNGLVPDLLSRIERLKIVLLCFLAKL